MRRSTQAVAAIVAAVTLGGLISIGTPVSAVASTVTGTVFQDFNSNGTDNLVTATGVAKDIGIGGIEVKAYDSTGALVGTATTASDGTYTLNVSGNATSDLRIEFAIPASNPLSAFRSSFAGTNSGTSVQFVSLGATSVDYGINVPGEFCQNQPNISVSRLCAGTGAGVSSSPSAWVTRYDGGPYSAGSGYVSSLTDAFTNWTSTKSATRDDTGAILGMSWDPSSGRVYHSAYVRRHAELYESGGTPRPGAIFVTTPNGTTAAQGTGGTTAFLVDLETLVAGDQFSNSNPAGPGYIPSNAVRDVAHMMDGVVDGGANNDGVDSDLVVGHQGVFEEVGKAGIGDIETDGEGHLWAVSLYDKNLYQVTLPASGAPTQMVSLGDITSGVTCTNGSGRPFSVKLWRGNLYLGVVCDASGDFDAASPSVLTRTNLTFTVVRYDLTAGSFSTFFGPHALNTSGNVTKGRSYSTNSSDVSSNWNPWTDTFGNHNYYQVRPSPMLSEIEFDRDGSMILAFRDRNGDQLGLTASEDPDGSYADRTDASGDLYRVCRTGTGYTTADYVFEGGTGCAQSSSPNSTFGVEYYVGDHWVFNSGGYGGHGETVVGLSEQVPGFPEILTTAYDPYSYADYTYYSGGVRWLLNSTGDAASTPNAGSGVMYYNGTLNGGLADAPLGPNSVGGFMKTNGMSDIEALCDQAPIQIGNRVWIDTDKDGIQDPGETPVAGATVRLYAADGTTLLGTAITDANGQYYFASNVAEAAAGTGDNSGGGIAAGSAFVIRMDNPADFTGSGPLAGYGLTTTTATDPTTSLDTSVDNNAATVNSYPQLTTATLRPGVNDHTYDIGFNNGSSPTTTTTVAGGTVPVGLGNYVWIDANKDGVRGPTEKPIKGVVVTLFNPDGTPAKTLDGKAATATTDANGYYFIDNLAPGSYFATFSIPAGYKFTSQAPSGSAATNDSNADPVTGRTAVFTIGSAAGGGTQSDASQATKAILAQVTIGAGIVPTGTVTVGNFVWRDRNGNGIQGPADSGVKGAILTLRNADGTAVTDAFGRAVKPITTGRDGKFLFANLLPGQYVVRVTYPKGFFPTSRERGTRGVNSSSFRATSRVLAAGESDLTLDFGMVYRSVKVLPTTR